MKWTKKKANTLTFVSGLFQCKICFPGKKELFNLKQQLKHTSVTKYNMCLVSLRKADERATFPFLRFNLEKESLFFSYLKEVSF